MKQCICFVAGHSGGHITPCLTLAHAHKEKNPTDTIIFFTSRDHLSQQLTQDPIITKRYTTTLNKFPYKKIYLYPLFAAQFCWTFIKSLYIFVRMRPIHIITSGGYTAIPVCYAARMLGIPLKLWELNALPGKTTAWLAKHAQEINICYPQTKKCFKTCTLKSYPVRFKPEQKISQEQARIRLNFDQQKFTVFILGGSQGSQELNKLMQKCVEQEPALANKIQVIHQTGKNNLVTLCSWYQEHNIPTIVFDYVADLAPLFCAADLVVSRAGAGALAEIAFFEKPALIIPLILKHDPHQRLNAHAHALAHPTITVTSEIKEAPEQLIKLIKKIKIIDQA